jgi:hypothetical protein
MLRLERTLTLLLNFLPGSSGHALGFADLCTGGRSTDYGNTVGREGLAGPAVGNVQTAHGARAAQEPLSGWIPRWRASRIISGILAVDGNALEDIVREAALSLARRRLDICNESVRAFEG